MKFKYFNFDFIMDTSSAFLECLTLSHVLYLKSLNKNWHKKFLDFASGLKSSKYFSSN